MAGHRLQIVVVEGSPATLFGQTLLAKVEPRFHCAETQNAEKMKEIIQNSFPNNALCKIVCRKGISCVLSSLVRKWPQNVEKFARFPGGEKSVESCHVCGCHGFFLVPTIPLFVSATPQQTELCVKFSIFHAWREILVKIFRFGHPNPGNVARGKFHQNFTPNFTTPLAEKN